MQINFSRQFVKQFDKLGISQKNKFDQRFGLWREDPLDQRLRDHALRGKYEGCRSINITGDLRAIYKFVSKDDVLFVAIGTHSQLYS